MKKLSNNAKISRAINKGGPLLNDFIYAGVTNDNQRTHHQR